MAEPTPVPPGHVTLELAEHYRVAFPGGTTELMRVGDRWRGLVELVGKDGKVLVVSEPESNPFAKLFDPSGPSDPVIVIKASPSYHAVLKPAEPAPTATGSTP